jgi:hypothetical protein
VSRKEETWVSTASGKEDNEGMAVVAVTMVVLAEVMVVVVVVGVDSGMLPSSLSILMLK